MTNSYLRILCLSFIFCFAAGGAGADQEVGGSQVAGVSPSLAVIMRDFQTSDIMPQVGFSSQKSLAEALAEATQDRRGPFLVIAGDGKLRILELKPAAITKP